MIACAVLKMLTDLKDDMLYVRDGPDGPHWQTQAGA